MRVVARSLSVLTISAALVFAASPAQAADPIDPSIEGTVTAATNTPVAGVTVTATQGTTVVASTATDAAGNYSLDVADGSYSLSFTSPTPALSSTRSVFVETPRNWPLDIVLTAPTAGRVNLTGDVTLDGGTPLTGGAVMFAGSGNSAGTDGFFSLVKPAGTSGKWSISGRAVTGPSSSLNLTASGGPNMTMLQDTDTQLTVPVTTTVVTVTNSAGQPVSGAKVRLNVGGYGNPDGSMPVFAGAPVFMGSWTADGVSDASGRVMLIRPVLTTAVIASLIIDSATPSVLRSSFTSVLVPTSAGSFTQALVPVVAPTPVVSATPSASATPTVSPTPVSTPTASSTPTPVVTPTPTPTPSVTASGTVAFSDGTPVGFATVIPRDLTQPVNGGNSANASGQYSLPKPAGFSGVWTLSTRAQASLPVRDPLTFYLVGSTVSRWSSNLQQDFTIPTNLYRMRILDSTGAPVSHARIGIAVKDTTAATSASVSVIPGDAPMVGYWSGYAYTGADGWAQVPGIRMVNTVPVAVTVDVDPGVRLEGRVVTVSSKDLAETVVVLSGFAPTLTSVTPTSAMAGDLLTVNGTNLLGTSSATIGGVASSFTVLSDTQLTVRVPSNAISGPVTLTTAGGTVSSSPVTVTYPTLSISSSALPAGQVAQAYSAQLTATGGVAPYTWSRISGALPSGVTLNSTGVLSGTPTNAATTSATYRVTDSRGTSVTRVLSISISPKPNTAPGPIDAVSGTEGAGRISLAWVMPTSNGGNRITGFQVQRSLDGTTWSTLITSTGSTSMGTSFVAPVGQRAMYRVAAINLSGVGEYGAKSSTGWLTAYGTASSPRNVVTTSYGTLVTVTWSVPASNGGRAITGYRVRTSINGISWTTRIEDSKSTATRASVTLPTGRRSYVQVAAITLGGVGAWSTTTQVR
jgi:hypothetical protein